MAKRNGCEALFCLLTFLVCFASASSAQDAPIGAIALAFAEVAKTLGKGLDAYMQRITETHGELDQEKKDALASIAKELTDLAALKRNMAKQFRCLASAQGPASSDSPCWRTLRAQNEEFESTLTKLKRNMDLADPNWHSAHSDEVKALDDLYWEKMNLAGGVAEFVQNSSHGMIFVRVDPDPVASAALATAVESEAAKLDEAARRLVSLLRQPTPPASSR